MTDTTEPTTPEREWHKTACILCSANCNLAVYTPPAIVPGPMVVLFIPNDPSLIATNDGETPKRAP